MIFNLPIWHIKNLQLLLSIGQQVEVLGESGTGWLRAGRILFGRRMPDHGPWVFVGASQTSREMKWETLNAEETWTGP